MCVDCLLHPTLRHEVLVELRLHLGLPHQRLDQSCIAGDSGQGGGNGGVKTSTSTRVIIPPADPACHHTRCGGNVRSSARVGAETGG